VPFACRSSWREREFGCWEGVRMGSTRSASRSGSPPTPPAPLAAAAVSLPLHIHNELPRPAKAIESSRTSQPPMELSHDYPSEVYMCTYVMQLAS